MSNQDENNTASFFHLTYCASASPCTEKFCAVDSSTQILRTSSYQIHRCINSSLHAGCEPCCGQIGEELQSSADDNDCCERLALLVSPTLTHKFLNTVNSLGLERCSDEYDTLNTNDIRLHYIESELEFKKSIHPCLCDEGREVICHNSNDAEVIPRLSICGIITSEQDSALPADIVLLQLENRSSINTKTKKSNQFVKELHRYGCLLNHETAAGAPWSVMKAFLVHSITSAQHLSIQHAAPTAKVPDGVKCSIDTPALPCCPVCLHRIDPRALGLIDIKHEHKCSQWCSTSRNDSNDIHTGQYTCTNEMKLFPWRPPAMCHVCDVIRRREWTLEMQYTPSDRVGSKEPPSRDCLKCHQCGMTTTLWVCLTCAVIGCGRYTRKHAADHFTNTGHPYSLELATMRIWDYENGSFVHRRDLLECPILSVKWSNDAGTADIMQCASPLIAPSRSINVLESRAQEHLKNNNELIANPMQDSLLSLHQSPPTCQRTLSQNIARDKLSYPPKKSMMVSEEYEALLQSALEDQAAHFEGEISHLRAELVSGQANRSECITDKEFQEINALRRDIKRLNCELENVSSALLKAHSDESKNRALSQKLLMEQSISKDLLDKLHRDTSSEHDSCRQRMDDMKLQIEDLTVNLRMRAQIVQSEELNQAQIFGTAGAKDGDNQKKKGKKLRYGRKK